MHKDKISNKNKVYFNKKGQVTIFIIIALVIVILAVLAYLFVPRIIKSIRGLEENPNQFIQGCLQEEFETIVEKISLQGGSLNPEHYYMYNDSSIEYLCYTNQYYLTCVVQQPLLKQHIENEIAIALKDKIDSCFESLDEEFTSQGYEVSLTKGTYDIELLPKRIIVKTNSNLALNKEATERFVAMQIIFNNNLYELTSIANSIINSEATIGSAETTVYMTYYKDLKVEKYKQGDGSTIYILTDRNTEDKFQFASRSVAWPSVY